MQQSPLKSDSGVLIVLTPKQALGFVIRFQIRPKSQALKVFHVQLSYLLEKLIRMLFLSWN